MANLQDFSQYVEYINNTGMKPIQPEIFDDDWEPIGPMVRRDMLAAGIIYEGGKDGQLDSPEGIYLRPDLAV